MAQEDTENDRNKQQPITNYFTAPPQNQQNQQNQQRQQQYFDQNYNYNYSNGKSRTYHSFRGQTKPNRANYNSNYNNYNNYNNNGNRYNSNQTRQYRPKSQSQSQTQYQSQSSTNSTKSVVNNNSNTNNNTNNFEFKIVKGDLFSCPNNACLAHCISRDLGMGKGIAVLFKKKFGGVNILRQQNCQIGECGILNDSNNNRFVYYLITKERYFHKPTYKSLTQTLEFMCKHAMLNGVKHICMPKIGCGLDRLQWNKVENIIKNVFKSSGVNVTVYVL